MEYEELYNEVSESLKNGESSLLEKEANVLILEEIVQKAIDNPLFGSLDSGVVVNNIVGKFKKRAVKGDMETLTYVGGRDIFDRNYEFDRRQKAVFLSHPDEEFLELNIWGRFPGFKETGPFRAGTKYQIEIIEKEVTRGDGSTVVYRNPNKYVKVGEYNEGLKDTILTYEKTFSAMVDDAVGSTELSEEVVELLDEEFKYETVIIEFETVSVRPVRVTKKVLEYETWSYRAVEPTEYYNVFHTAKDTGTESVVFSLTGTAILPKSGINVTLFLTFYPNRLAQQFIYSKDIDESYGNSDFQASQPEDQCEFLKLILAGKKFRAVGDVRKITLADDDDRLLVNMDGMALIEE